MEERLRSYFLSALAPEPNWTCCAVTLPAEVCRSQAKRICSYIGSNSTSSPALRLDPSFLGCNLLILPKCFPETRCERNISAYPAGLHENHLQAKKQGYRPWDALFPNLRPELHPSALPAFDPRSCACAAMLQVSTSNFFQVVGVVWEYLHPSTQQAIRQSSSTGRTLNDSRTTDLVVRLGHGKPDMIDADRECHGAEGLRSSEEAGGDEPLTPSELRAMVAAIVQRGARLSKLHLRCFKRPKRWHLPVREREEQL